MFPSLSILKNYQKLILLSTTSSKSINNNNDSKHVIPSSKKNRNKSRHPLKAILAGGISGAIEISITYPTEYIKTQLQLHKKLKTTGIIKFIQYTYNNYGIFGFYRGLSCLLFFSVPKNASRFFAFENLKKIFEDKSGKLTSASTLLCGLGSGIFEAITVVIPMETIKVKLIHDQLNHVKSERKYKNFFHGVYTIIKEQGLKETYKGIFPTILKQGSNQAIRWLVYLKLSNYLANGKDVKNISPFKTACAGGTAGAVSVLMNTPIDVIKTRFQGLQANEYNGIIDCANKIWRNEGITGFYKGMGPRLVRVVADVAIVMVVYEQVMKLLDSFWDTDD